MTEITDLLTRVREGDRRAIDAVFAQLYPELRRLALQRISRGERTLTPTVLIHEAYLRLLGNARLGLVDRRHFMACAARAMRGVLIDHVRRAGAIKRGDGAAAIPLDAIDAPEPVQSGEELLALDQALDHLEAISPRQREVVEMRYFAGLEFAEIAELLECSERTAKREWERARAFLHVKMAT